MVWTKQQLAAATAVAALSLVSGVAAGFMVGSRHHKQSPARTAQPPIVHQESTDIASETDVDAEDSSTGAIPSNGRHAGTRFLAAKRDFTDAEAPKKEAPAVANTATNANTNATVAAAEAGSTTSRRRGSRRTP